MAKLFLEKRTTIFSLIFFGFAIAFFFEGEFFLAGCCAFSSAVPFVVLLIVSRRRANTGLAPNPNTPPAGLSRSSWGWFIAALVSLGFMVSDLIRGETHDATLSAFVAMVMANLMFERKPAATASAPDEGDPQMRIHSPG